MLDELGLDPPAPIAVVRTPPEVSLYHRFENELFRSVLERLREAQTVVLPRTPEQREEIAALGGFIIPERAIDAQSLIAFADVVVSAGGTMNREAVALGTPVYTTFEGRLGAVDEQLIAEGRLLRLVESHRRNGRKALRGTGASASGAIRGPSVSALPVTPTICGVVPRGKRARATQIIREPAPLGPAGDRRMPACGRLLPGVLAALRRRASPQRYENLFADTVVFVVLGKLVVFAAFGLYHKLWRFVDQRDFESIVKAVVTSSVLLVVVLFLFSPGGTNPPRGVIALDFLLTLGLVAGIALPRAARDRAARARRRLQPRRARARS